MIKLVGDALGILTSWVLWGLGGSPLGLLPYCQGGASAGRRQNMALLWGSHMGKAHTREAPWRCPILGCDVGPALFVCLMFFSWMDAGYRGLCSIRFCPVFFHAPSPLPDLVPTLCLILPFLTLGQPLLLPLLPYAPTEPEILR